MTTAGDPGPDRLDGILQPRSKLTLGSHVLQHAKLTACSKDAFHFSKAPNWIANAAKYQPAHHGVEGAGAKGKLLRAGVHEWHRRRSASSALECVWVQVQTDHANAWLIQWQIPPGPAADVQRSSLGPLNDGLAPPAEAKPIVDRRHRIVQQRDVLDSSHGPGDPSRSYIARWGDIIWGIRPAHAAPLTFP